MGHPRDPHVLHLVKFRYGEQICPEILGRIWGEVGSVRLLYLKWIYVVFAYDLIEVIA